MILNKNKIGLCFIVCLIFITFLYNSNVYAAEQKEGWICTTDITDTQSGYLGVNKNDKCEVTTSLSDFNVMANNLKVNYCKAFLESAKNDFTGLDFIDSYTITGKYSVLHTDDDGNQSLTTEDYSENYSNVVPITSPNLSFLNLPSESAFTITVKIGDLEYKIQCYTRKHYTVYTDTTTNKKTYYLQNKSNTNAANNKEMYKNQAKMADNAVKMFELFKDSAFEGIVAGSIGSGYNVGVAYSEKQKPLSDVMSLVGNGYEFNDLKSVDFTFSYYYSPIFGKMYALKDPKLPKTRDEWIAYADAHSSFIKNGSIELNSGFSDFVSSLSDTTINDKGEKISEVTIEGGAKKFNVSGSDNPKSVISYNMPMATPYLFQISNGKGKLMTEALKIVENYTYCIFNERIYDENNKAVTTMPELRISRDNLYLYKQEISETIDGETKKSKSGIVLVGYFDECVVDTTQEMTTGNASNLLLTGRKVGFTNGYSDALDFNNSNVNLMFTVGESGKEAFSPVNVAFPVSGVDLKKFDLYDVWSGRASQVAPELTEEVNKIMTPMTDTEMFEYINTKKWHGSMPSTCKAVRFFVNFGPLTVESSGNEEGSTVNPSNTTQKYAFYIIRNNKYINDANLISWLKTDTAKSLTYVDADGLLAKITGDFRETLGKLTYEDWQKMQTIKSELTNDKDMWLIRTMNVMAIVLGVALIVLAILFMLAYWVDVFNTLTDFSILQFISMGNLYPIADKCTIPYITEQKGNTKFVTFKDVLILACIMIAAGVLFMNVSYLVGIIANLYNYIMFVLGGARS